MGGEWFDNSFYRRLDANYSQVVQLLGSSHSIFDRPKRNRLNEEDERKKWKNIRDKTQRCTFLAIHLKRAPDHLARMRHKLGRWKLDSSDPMLLATLNVKQKTPEYFPRRCIHNLKQLSKLATPRVRAACFGTIWNRWTTAARFQNDGICLLCQQIRTEDKIEHYSRCPVTKDFGRKFLRLNRDHDLNLHTFTLTNPRIDTTERLTSTALLIYAVYNLTNTLRKDGEKLTRQEAYNALTQHAREAVRGHPRSARILRQLWTENKATPLPSLREQSLNQPSSSCAESNERNSRSTPRRNTTDFDSDPQPQSHRGPQFQPGGFLNTTANIRPWTPENNRWAAE